MIAILTWVVLCLTALTTLCYCYHFFYLFIPFLKKRPVPQAEQLRRYAILVAARNEEKVLPHLLESIRNQDYPAALFSIFVVADNCTDNTAKIAREHGATVFERFNTEQVGKGYAISYLLEQVQKEADYEQFDAFLVFDADNLLAKDYLKQMNRMPVAGYEAFCGYRNTKNFGDSWVAAGYGLWYLHESTHMNRSRFAIGTSCAVNGTGFGFTRQLLERIGGWPFHCLTEDIEFNQWCASHQVKIGYCHDAIAYDEQPITFKQSWTQRTRWAQGGIQVSLRYGSRLAKGLTKGTWSRWACFEMLTLCLWGYGMSGLAAILSFLLSLCTGGLLGLGLALGGGIIGAYFSMAAIGAWTMLTEHRRVYASKGRKIGAVFTFPFFMLSFIPIAGLACFSKFEWKPIEHTVAISGEEIGQK